MGFGVLHLNAGLDYLFGIDHSQWVQVLLITLMMGAAVAVAVAGVEKGVRVMSDINLFWPARCCCSCCSPGLPSTCSTR